MSVEAKIVECNLEWLHHQRDLLKLMDLYALDPMSGGHFLSQQAVQNLIPQLRKHPAFYGWIAYHGGHGEFSVGFAICFLTFSTFAGLPALNIHDISVTEEYRGLGISKKLLEAIETKAKELGCCKLTLEVREDNEPARTLYRKFNFDRMVVGEQGKPMEFWEKHLQ